MGTKMGMKNLILAAELQPRIMRETRGLLSPNMHAFSTLITMARHTYDWEPTARQRINHVPCRLYERGILVRDFSHAPGLEGCLRATVGTPDQNDALVAGLRDFVMGRCDLR